MTNQTRPLSVILASAVLMGASMAGCSDVGTGRRPVASIMPVQKLAPRIEKALAEKDYERALTQAEELVAAAPQEGAYRALLGRTYLANGRYGSARTAFQDAMTLGNRDVRTIVSLSLTEVGLGSARSARNLLADHIEDLPAADYGLAMAIAGNAEEGVRALVEAVHQPEATAQTRQNLAYALALGGAWAQARLIAGQDLSAKEAERRISEWSRVGDEQQRVIAMLGVSPRSNDSGLPARLALHVEPAPVQLAEAGLVAQARADLPALTPAEPPSAMAADEAPAVQAGSAQLVAASHVPMHEAREEFRRGETPVSAPARATLSIPGATPTRPAVSDWVIQLGAFDSAPIAHAKWRQISRQQPQLGAYQEVFSQTTVHGRLFHRLAIRGFQDRNAALATCRSLSAANQSCFVRRDDASQVRMADEPARKGSPVAAHQPASRGQRVAAR